jgi:hypothetical protein
MPTISWQYKDFWEWFIQIEDDKRKTVAMVELIGNGWLARLSAEAQAHIFQYAPDEILLNLKHIPKIVKRRTLEILEYERSKKDKRIRKR